MNKISVISFVSYDFDLLLESLKSYIDEVDEVVLGLDRARLTWAGEKFLLPDDFFSGLAKIDPHKKTKVIPDDFYLAGTSALELCTRERNILSTHCAKGAWIVSLDADEAPVSANDVFQFLRNLSADNVAVYGHLITLLKQDGEKSFVVENDNRAMDHFPLATKKTNAYVTNRVTSEPIVFSPACVIHNSWARTQKQFDLKLSHRYDFRNSNFSNLWASIDTSNFTEYANFHPTHPDAWERLIAVDAERLEQYAQEKYASEKNELAWSGVATQARLKLFEEKVIARDANLTRVMEKHESDIIALKAEFDNQLATQVRNFKELKLRLDAELLANKARQQR